VKRVFALALSLFAGAATAQSYPQKPVRLLLTFSAGGQADILARAHRPEHDRVHELEMAGVEVEIEMDLAPGASAAGRNAW